MPASRSEHLSPMHKISRILCVMHRTVFESRHGVGVGSHRWSGPGGSRGASARTARRGHLGRRDRAPPTGLLPRGRRARSHHGSRHGRCGGGHVAGVRGITGRGGSRGSRTGDRHRLRHRARGPARGLQGRASQSHRGPPRGLLRLHQPRGRGHASGHRA